MCPPSLLFIDQNNIKKDGISTFFWQPLSSSVSPGVSAGRFQVRSRHYSFLSIIKDLRFLTKVIKRLAAAV